MTPVAMVAVGTRLRYAGREWVVAGKVGLDMVLRDQHGQELTTSWPAVMIAPDYAVVGEEEPLQYPLELSFEALSDDVRAPALILERHLREVLFGAAAPDQPINPTYDAGASSLNARLRAKVAELKAEDPTSRVSERQLKRWLAAYREFGKFGLVDRRHLRLKVEWSAEDRIVMLAMDAVRDALRGRSDVSLGEVRRLTRRELESRGQLAGDAPAPGQVAMPGRTKFSQLLHAVAPTLFKSARQRDSIEASLTRRPFGRATADRPGQVVQVDYTSFDLMALSEIDGSEIRLRLLVALDLYSRAVLNWDLVEVDPRGVDAARLIIGVMFPKLWVTSWPEASKWRYTGVPQEVALALFGLPDGTELAGPLPVHIEGLVVDNGKIFIGGHLALIIDQFAITVYNARPYKGSDKAHVEVLFRIIRLRFTEAVVGYTGPNTQHRGKAVRALHTRTELLQMIGEMITAEYNERAHDGCYDPRRPRVKLSPNEMLDLGLQTQGFMHVPRSRNAYYAALRDIQVKTINDNGIRVEGRRYDGAALNPYRKSRSPYQALGGRWPIKIDDRDPSYIFFSDPYPAEGEPVYHAIPWVDADHLARPFQDGLQAASRGAYETRGATNHAEIDARRDARRDRYEDQVHAARVERRDALESLQALNRKPDERSGKLDRPERNTQSRQQAASLERARLLGPDAPPPLSPAPAPVTLPIAELDLRRVGTMKTVNLDDLEDDFELDDLEDE